MKNKQALVVAVVMGLISVLMLFSYVNKVRQEATSGMELVRVLVAKQDLSGGTVLEAAKVAYRQYPAKYVEERAVTPEESALVLGKRLKWGVQEKRPILWSDIEMVESREVSSLVEKGMRAVTVPVTAVTGAGGLLEPNMLVDVLYIFDINSLAPKKAATKGTDQIKNMRDMMMAKALDRSQNEKGIMVLAQNVKVMAVGDRTAYSVDTDAGKGGYSTVTLLLEPRMSQVILYAQENGKIILSMKNKSDVEPVEGDTIVTAEDVIALIGGAYDEIRRRDLEVYDVTE